MVQYLIVFPLPPTPSHVGRGSFGSRNYEGYFGDTTICYQNKIAVHLVHQ
jgi:hypothetical protein